MSKYIDSEKLIAEIEKRQEELSDHNFHSMAEEYDNVLGIIDSLQQEQPELLGYNKALLEVKSKVDELYEEASIGLNEYDSGLYNGIAETCMKLRGFIKARLDSDEQTDKYETALEKAREWMPNVNQGGHSILIDIFPELGEGLDPRYGGRKHEQPEVDLEEEYKEWWETRVSGNVNIEHTMEWFMHETARHFWNKGYNARKEE